LAYTHHERYDGKGYPQGLSENNIPLFARIVTVADAFDALRFVRLYHDAHPSQEASRRIIAGVGSQFDPAVVEAFKECHAEFEAVPESTVNRIIS
ncbi:MAG: hypothetical protein FJ088_16390, partial [Deltaproteobacteria bacterium]|nr:hypothetical protein [Deltaproteobacteria bacterium]